MQIQLENQKRYILYCSLAGFVASWAISGMLALIDYSTATPVGTFFAVIGISLGFNDIGTAQYVGFALHLLTGMVAGNIFGQVAVFLPKMRPYNARRGIVQGMIVGLALWAVLFFPLATFGIQPRLNTLLIDAPNSPVYNIATHFQNTYYLIIGGAVLFHILYGTMLGYISGRVSEIRSSKYVDGYTDGSVGRISK